MKLTFALITIALALSGCGDTKPVDDPFIEVKIVLIHETQGAWTDTISDFTVYERPDTRERITLGGKAIGKVGDTFTLPWSRLYNPKPLF